MVGGMLCKSDKPSIIIIYIFYITCNCAPLHDRPGRYRWDNCCKWPVPELDVWQLMLSFNTPVLQAQPYKVKAADVVCSFSHFLPTHGLPYPQGLAEMVKAVGCEELDRHIQQVGGAAWHDVACCGMLWHAVACCAHQGIGPPAMSYGGALMWHVADRWGLPLPLQSVSDLSHMFTPAAGPLCGAHSEVRSRTSLYTF